MPPKDSELCPVCNWALRGSPRSGGDAIRFDCARCGSFIFSRSALEDLPSVLRTDKQRAFLSYSIRRAQGEEQTPKYLSDQIEHILESAVVPSPYEQADNLIRWIGDKVDGPGASVKMNHRDHGAIAGSLLGYDGFRFVVGEMLNSGLLVGTWHDWTYTEPGGGTTRQARGLVQVTLSFEGWSRYEELKRGSASGYTAFMAMQYGDAELDCIVGDHFRPAVDKTGFKLRRLDDQPRAGLIDDRLRLEIKACRFLIADLTHGNLGAHWEAGYAEGLGKPVVYTCRENVFNDPDHEHHPHFDTNHHLTVPWDPDNIEDACQRLKETIRATMPDARQQD